MCVGNSTSRATGVKKSRRRRGMNKLLVRELRRVFVELAVSPDVIPVGQTIERVSKRADISSVSMEFVRYVSIRSAELLFLLLLFENLISV